MATAKVQSRGQVTLPRSVREQLGCKAGDTVAFQNTAEGAVALRVLPRRRLADLLESYQISQEVDEQRDRAEWQDIAARDVIGRE